MMDTIISVDTSIRRIVITEDEDLDLDKLLLGDNSGAIRLAPALVSPATTRTSPLSSSPACPHHHHPESRDTAATTSAQRRCSSCSQEDTTTTPSSPIQALEEEDEDGDGGGHWVMPAPAQPGDYLANSIHKVPSKSILKKTSSYGNFETISVPTSQGGGSATSTGLAKKASSFLSFQHMESSQSSTGSTGRSRVANSALDNSLAGGVTKVASKTSYLCMDSSNTSQGSRSTQNAIGWDLDDSNSPEPSLYNNASSPGRNALFVPTGGSLPSMPNLVAPPPPGGDNNDAPDADRAAGTMDSSGSRHSGTSSSAKIRRNVSFNSVNVREYDRTVGDNPSCRSGPPLSLDWSYSKKYVQTLDEYEIERSTERVPNRRKLHVNKWKRRNMLAYQWGHTDEEMKAARKSTKKMQRQRSLTQIMLPIHKAEEAFIGLKNIITKKNKGGDNDGSDADWSDMSNSGSTKDTTNQRYHQERFGDKLHQDTIVNRIDTTASSSARSLSSEKKRAH